MSENNRPLTNDKVALVLQCLQNLDMQLTVDKDGKEVRKPYIFSGTVLYRISRNIRACKEVLDVLREANTKLSEQIEADAAATGKFSTPEKEAEFQREMKKLLSVNSDLNLRKITLFEKAPAGDLPDDAICLTRTPIPSTLTEPLLDYVFVDPKTNE